MSFDDALERLHGYQELRHAWREATADWLAARSHYERLRTDAGTDRQRLGEAAQTYAFATHRRAALARDVEHFGELLEAATLPPVTRASAR